MSKYSKGDVVRLNHYAFGNRNGQLATVVRVRDEGLITVRMGDGLEWEVSENTVIGVTLQELRDEIGGFSEPGFIVDGLTVDEMLVNELEAGQEEAYETFQRAVKKSKCRMALRMVEMFVTLKERFKKRRKRKRKEDP